MKLTRRQAMAALAAVAASMNLRGSEPSDQDATVRGDTDFALDLYGILRGQEGNLFLSPYSITSALAMTLLGARGNTADEMVKTLHLSLPSDRLHDTYGRRLRGYNAVGGKRPYQLSIANALWGQKGMQWRRPFIEAAATHYKAKHQEVDFVGATEKARVTINDWVEEQTQKKIKDLLKPGILNALTRMVLTNAIYFKGTWVWRFDPKRTTDGVFFINEAKRVDAKLMTQKSTFKYMQTEQMQAVELPYAGKELSMVVILPRKRDGLPDLERGLTRMKLSDWMTRMSPMGDLSVTLPRFKITAEFSLKDTLSKLGMKDAFSPGKCDLSGMAGNPGELFLSEVIHKAFVEVNEEGTEAAAATAVVVKTLSKVSTPVFRADHPFLFAIRETNTGAILFMGRLNDPTA